MEAGFYRLMAIITDVGDSAVLGVLVLALSICLLAQGCRREAIVIFGSFLVTSLCMSIAKILLMGCGSELRHMGLHSPSGHSALSIAVLGTLGLLIRDRMQGKRRYLPLIVLLALAFAIAYSRVALGFHSAKEVAIGIIIGVLVLAVAVAYLKRTPARPFNVYAVALITLAVGVAMHGIHLPAENILQLLAAHFRALTNCA